MYMKTREKKERDLKRRKVYILFEDRDLSLSLKLCLAFDEMLFPLSLKIFLRPFFKIFNEKNDCFWIFNWFFSHPAHNSDANVGEYPIIRKGKEEDPIDSMKNSKRDKIGKLSRVVNPFPPYFAPRDLGLLRLHLQKSRTRHLTPPRLSNTFPLFLVQTCISFILEEIRYSKFPPRGYHIGSSTCHVFEKRWD